MIKENEISRLLIWKKVIFMLASALCRFQVILSSESLYFINDKLIVDFN